MDWCKGRHALCERQLKKQRDEESGYLFIQRNSEPFIPTSEETPPQQRAPWCGEEKGVEETDAEGRELKRFCVNACTASAGAGAHKDGEEGGEADSGDVLSEADIGLPHEQALD